MPQSYCNLVYHLTFSTKDREPWIDDEVKERLHRYLGGAIREEGGVALAVGGIANHVHILARLRQDKKLSDTLRNVKSMSSTWIHKTFGHLSEFEWQPGYGAFTVSASQIEKTRQYILNQEEHHRTRSFEEEFIALLNSHKIEYDKRYLWK